VAVINDSEQKIAADLERAVADAIRRAIALGARVEKDAVKARIVRAIENGTNSPDLVIADDTGAHIALVEVKAGKHYGDIVRSVRAALYNNRPQGIFRKQIPDYCGRTMNVNFSEASALNALRALTKDGLARYHESKHVWLPTKKLVEEFERELIDVGNLVEENGGDLSHHHVREAAE
jgi:hypothetical protein